MTDEATTEPATTVEGDVQPNAEPDAAPAADDPKEIAALRKEAAKYRTERNETREQLADVQAQLAELSTKAAKGEKADQLQSEIDQLGQRLQRIEAAREAGLPKGFEDRLKGDTPEALLEDAQSLAEFLKPSEPARDDLDAGPRGSAPKPLTLDEQIAKAEADGDVATSMRLKAQMAYELGRSSAH